MGMRGPRQSVDPGTLYGFADQYYRDFRRLGEGAYCWKTDIRQYRRLIEEDEKQYKKIIDKPEEAKLSDEQEAQLREHVEEEIRAGRLKESEKEVRLAHSKDAVLQASREWNLVQAMNEARIQLRIPGEPDVLKGLLQARTVTRVREICKDAPNWPISTGSELPQCLSQHAAEFVAAKKDRRFPCSGRPSSQLKRLWFLSRALAGAVFGIKTRTAINLVGSKRPEEIFKEARAGKSARKKRRLR